MMVRFFTHVKRHMTGLISVLGLSILCSSPVLSQSSNAEQVLWNKVPIVLELTPKQERRIHFPQAIRYWLPDSLQGKVSALAADGVLYIQAHRAFEVSRIRVQLQPSGKVYLLDAIHQASGDFASDLIVNDPDFLPKRTIGTKSGKPGEDWLVRLTRFAAQSMVAPERLQPHDPEIRQLPPPKNPAPLITLTEVDANPVASWRGGGLTVTAVELRNQGTLPVLMIFEAPPKHNKTPENTPITPHRWLRLDTDVHGDWLAMTPQHSSLAPRGMPQDHTYLYVISKHSFALASQGGAR